MKAETLQPFNPATRSSNVVHRFALLTALATFPLLFLGGLVTSKGAGLAVPDWPTTFGYNMFLYPWSKMVGGIFYEHSHRLVASGVGLLTMILALLLWLHERRRWLRWLGVAALALVIVQGVIGGLRVVLVEETLAIIHAGFAQAFFALMVGLVFFTSEEWRERPQKIQVPDAGRMRRLCVLTTSMIYLQGLFGAVLRYTGARLDAHLILAALVTLHVVILGVRLLKFHSDRPKLLRPVVLLSGLLILQLALGLGSYLGKFTSFGMALPSLAVVALTTTHVVTGALMLVTSLVLTLRSYRLLTLPGSLVGQELFPARAAGGSEQVSA
ncbi:MAG: COX15/CtaA family protein [Deltaproteobacteria bacterium]|nr:COX15/CtaA family protein [Deltaproteobacteria bacterium]